MIQSKDDFYRAATSKLLKQIDSMNMTDVDRHQAKKLVMLFRNRFKDPEVKMATFGPDLNNNISAFTYDSDGFCKASSCTFSDMLGPKDWQLMYINDLWTFGPHHYLMHIPSKQVFDLTADQYTHSGIEIPYYMGYPVRLDQNERKSAERFAAVLNINKKQND
ncbi:MAG: hypothetical protein J6R22_00710 [Alphaproteobacteria bacterium]|nr:hypothetical protein [Alphaproteobacteria bacterium]